jgi:hypothetical protein
MAEFYLALQWICNRDRLPGGVLSHSIGALCGEVLFGIVPKGRWVRRSVIVANWLKADS